MKDQTRFNIILMEIFRILFLLFQRISCSFANWCCTKRRSERENVRVNFKLGKKKKVQFQNIDGNWNFLLLILSIYYHSRIIFTLRELKYPEWISTTDSSGRWWRIYVLIFNFQFLPVGLLFCTHYQNYKFLRFFIWFLTFSLLFLSYQPVKLNSIPDRMFCLSKMVILFVIYTYFHIFSRRFFSSHFQFKNIQRESFS